MLDSFAFGVSVPVSGLDAFHGLLLEWNAASSTGKFAPELGDSVVIEIPPPTTRTLLSEEPIKAVWLRLRQIQSITLASKLISERASLAKLHLTDEQIHSKAEGVAYALRNAHDYFHAADARNVSQKIVNLYYGCMSFAFAEMLASPSGAEKLSEIEENTKQGHGLYTVDTKEDGLGALAVGILSSGFFRAWMRSLNISLDHAPQKKPRLPKDLQQISPDAWIKIEQIFGSIPEIGDLFAEIFDSVPRWLTPTFDMNANSNSSRHVAKVSRTYAVFVDESGRMTKEHIAECPGPISEIIEVRSDYPEARCFRVAVDHPGEKIWWNALKLHHSPFKQHSLIRPIFGEVFEYRAICTVLLYSLSIVVRYRPSIWRRVQEGDQDHLKVLVEAFLAVSERVLPEQFLETITGRKVFAKQSNSIF
jgi:hypothetical protein